MVEQFVRFGHMRLDEALVHMEVDGHEPVASFGFVVGCCHEFEEEVLCFLQCAVALVGVTCFYRPLALLDIFLKFVEQEKDVFHHRKCGGARFFVDLDGFFDVYGCHGWCLQSLFLLYRLFYVHFNRFGPI